jgi:hypothetical protein
MFLQTIEKSMRSFVAEHPLFFGGVCLLIAAYGVLMFFGGRK